MITVATTVFSITIVTLQLGASQLSPRILRGFTADRGNQLVLGTFIATFAYTLLVLRTVQSESADRQVFVPAASVSLAMLLALTAIGSLIYFFHHATRTIQASVVIERTVEDTFGLIEARLAQDTEPDKTVVSEVVPGDDQVNVSAGRSGYVWPGDFGLLEHRVARALHDFAGGVSQRFAPSSLRGGPGISRANDPAGVRG
jgi:uncharacterized membrane protein